MFYCTYMMIIILKWLLNALALFIVSKLVPGVHLTSFGGALIAVVLIALVNTFIGPLLTFLTLPINFLTLGLFSIIINALLLMLAGSITPEFRVDGLGAGIVGSLLLSLISTMLHMLLI